MLLIVVVKLYKVIVLLEYFDLLLRITNLTGQDSQPCCNSLTLTICLMLAIMLRIMPRNNWPACMGLLEKCYQEYLVSQ